MKTRNLAVVAAFLSVSATVFAQSVPAAGTGLPAASGNPETAQTQPGPLGPGAAHRHGGRKMMRLDHNGDGQISRSEVQAAHERRMAAFDRADSNRDGNLSPDEMRAMGHERKGGRRGPGAPGGSNPLQPGSGAGYGPNG